MRILIIDESQPRAAILEEGLREGGYDQVEWLSDASDLLRRITALDPDMVLIGLESPSRDVLEQMFQVSRQVQRPIAMFVDHADASMTAASVDAGVSAYVVDGLAKERVVPIVDLAISRFNAFDRLQRELDQARTELADRKVIERAKGILMRRKGIEEGAAYTLLRKAAMNEKRKVAEVAASVITAAELLE